MRLICPNCDAQYEVPADVIPTAGRDVQCSNCGHVWFQAHPDAPEATPDPETADGPDLDDDAGDDPELDIAPAPVAEDTADEAEPRRRGVDPSVAQVLREEAEREARRRRAESGSLESQPELGLDNTPESEAERRRRQARERMARIRGDGTGDTAPEAPPPPPAEPPRDDTPDRPAKEKAGARSELLPDIDEINQSLRAGDERRPLETPQGRAVEAPASGGFLRGFSLVVLLVALLVLIYVATPRIVAAVPALADPLAGYVAAVDEGRLWLDRTVRSGLATLDGMSSEAGADQGS